MKLSTTTTVLAALLLGTSLPSAAAPTLLGDTISFFRAYPNTGTQYGNAIPNTTVAAGTSDVVSWTFGSSPNSINFDPEANTIRFDFLVSTSYGGTASQFDGYVVSGIDFDIDSVSILGNTTAYNVASLTNSAHSFSISFNGTSAPGSVLVGVQLRNPTPSGVPEPATAGLAAAALALLGVQSRRRRGAVPSR